MPTVRGQEHVSLTLDCQLYTVAVSPFFFGLSFYLLDVKWEEKQRRVERIESPLGKME